MLKRSIYHYFGSLCKNSTQNCFYQAIKVRSEAQSGALWCFFEEELESKHHGKVEIWFG